MDLSAKVLNLETRIQRLEGNTGNLASQSFPTIADFPPVGEEGVIYIDTATDTPYYWDGTQYVPFSAAPINPGSFIQNQTAVPQVGAFWIDGAPKITSHATISLELIQASAGAGIFMKLTNAGGIPAAYLTYADSGNPNRGFTVFQPAYATNLEWQFQANRGEVYISGELANAGEQVRFDHWMIGKAATVTGYLGGPKSLVIWDNEFGTHRVVIKSNGHWIVGGSTVDNGAAFQITNGALSLTGAGSDFPVINGTLFYRTDTNKFRACVNGTWQNLVTEDSLQAKVRTLTVSGGLVPEDNGNIVVLNSATPVNLTCTAGLPAGFTCEVWQVGAGQVTAVADAGITVNQADSLFKTRKTASVMSVRYLSATQVFLAGDLA